MGKNSCYNQHEKQKCGSLRVLAHLQACTGVTTTYTAAIWPHRTDYYTILQPFTQGGSFVVVLFAPCLHKNVCFLRCVGIKTCTAFLFFTWRPKGAVCPQGRRGENHQMEASVL